MNRKSTRQARKRKTAIYATTTTAVSKISITFDLSSQAISIAEASPDSLRSEVFYERSSGKEKVLLSAPAQENLAAFDPWGQIVGQCRYLFAIDTNTRVLAGRRVSLSLACTLPTRLGELPHKVELRGLCAYALFGVKAGVNPEALGWHLLIHRHLLPARFPASDVIGVVVDSDLGRLPRINARTEPYYAGHALPPSIMLIYASADAKTSAMPSEMIRYCDTMAGRLFDDLESQLERRPSPRNGDSNFEGFLPLRLEHIPPVR